MSDRALLLQWIALFFNFKSIYAFIPQIYTHFNIKSVFTSKLHVRHTNQWVLTKVSLSNVYVYFKSTRFAVLLGFQRFQESVYMVYKAVWFPLVYSTLRAPAAPWCVIKAALHVADMKENAVRIQREKMISQQ